MFSYLPLCLNTNTKGNLLPLSFFFFFFLEYKKRELSFYKKDIKNFKKIQIFHFGRNRLMRTKHSLSSKNKNKNDSLEENIQF